LSTTGFIHAPIALATWAGKLVAGQRRDDDAGADGNDAGTAPALADGFGDHAERVATLGELIGVQG